MKYPNIVYRCPGDHQCPGGTFDWLSVQNEAGFLAAVEDGWYPTIELAQQTPKDFDVAAIVETTSLSEIEEGLVDNLETEEVDEDSPPTREELELKAKELGIGFNKNTKDETLRDKIELELAELEEDGE